MGDYIVPARDHFSNFSPSIAINLMGGYEDKFFRLIPGAFTNHRIKVVVPSKGNCYRKFITSLDIVCRFYWSI